MSKSSWITVASRVEREVHDALAAEAVAADRTISGMIRRILREHVQRRAQAAQ